MPNEDFAYYFEKSGGPIMAAPMTAVELDMAGRHLPAELADVMREFGRFSWGRGIVQVCHPDDFRSVLKIVFERDKMFDYNKCHAFLYSVFGKLYFWVEKTGIGFVDLLGSYVICKNVLDGIRAGALVEKTIHVPFSDTMDAYDVLDGEGKPLYARAVKTLGMPTLGKCYGFTPMLQMGGERTLPALGIHEAKAHFGMLAQAAAFRLVRVKSPSELETVRIIGM